MEDSRDILNMFFIFFLLYSAFCTVFQISRYHIRNTWVMIIVMALLVNFSWPITRVLVDVSNVTMTYILHGSGNSGSGGVTGSGIMGKFADRTQFAKLVIGDAYFKGHKLQMNKEGVYQSLIMGIIVGIIFLLTIGTIAMVLIVRVVALTIYLIFASAGYVMAAFPSTQSYSSQWWSGFTKQLLVGPITLFAIILAISILDELGQMQIWGAAKTVSGENSVSSNIVFTLLQYLIAILVMWGAIIAAQKVGAEGTGFALNMAGKARNRVQRLGKGGAVLGWRATDRLVGSGVNYMANNENSALDRRVAKGMSVLRSLPTRARNFKDESARQYQSTIDESIARGVSIGPEWAGGDKKALERSKGKKIEEEKKKMREAPINTATDIGSEAKAQVLSEKRVDLLNEEVDELIKTFDKLDTETQKAVKRKMRESGYGHNVVQLEVSEITKKEAEKARMGQVSLSSAEIRQQALKNVYGKMEVKTLAKQKAIKEYGAEENPQYRDDFNFVYDRYQNLRSARSQQDFMDAMNTDEQVAFEKGGSRIAAREARKTMREMNS